MEEADKQTTVVFDGGINRTWETIWVKTIAVGLVVLFVAWVINEESIGCWGPTDDDTIHSVSLMVRSLLITIFVVVEECQGEDWDPCAFIMPNALNKKIR